MNNVDLEVLRKILGNSDIHIATALVEDVEVLSNNTLARAKCKVIPAEFEIVAQLTYDTCSQGAGDFTLPVPNDLVLVAFSDPQHAYIIRWLSSADDLIPLQAVSGHTYKKARAGKTLFLASDTRVEVGKGVATAPATEPMVLGTQLLTYLTDIHNALDSALNYILTGPVGIGNMGAPVPPDPTLVTNLTALRTSLASQKSQFLTTASTNIVSQTAFTER